MDIVLWEESLDELLEKSLEYLGGPTRDSGKFLEKFLKIYGRLLGRTPEEIFKKRSIRVLEHLHSENS